MLKDLKGTREQRIKAIEDSKMTFASLVKKIATSPNYRTNMGVEMEKMRLAMEIEKERLSDYVQYEDGIVDQPFLTPETLKEQEMKAIIFGITGQDGSYLSRTLTRKGLRSNWNDQTS